MSMEDYRLPAPLVGMLRAANLTGKPAVQTDLQPTKLAVTITWDLATSAPKKPKNRRSTKTAKPEPANRRQPATSSTSSVQQLPPARTAYPARTASSPDHAASDCDNTIASDSDAHLQPAKDNHTSSTADCDSTATRAQASPCWETTCALARRRRNPTNTTTTPCLSNRDCHQRPATSIHSRHYQRREVRATLLRQLRHSSAGSRKAISTGQEIQVREDFWIERPTSGSNDQTTGNKSSSSKPSEKNDQMRPSTSIFPPTSSEPPTAHGHFSRDWRPSTTTRFGGTTSTATREPSRDQKTTACSTSAGSTQPLKRAEWTRRSHSTTSKERPQERAPPCLGHG